MNRYWVNSCNDQQSLTDSALVLPPRRFQARTILYPLLFLALHWMAINVTAALYLVVYALSNSKDIPTLDLFADSVQLNRLLVEHYPIISVLYSALLIPLYLLFLYFQQKKNSRTVWFGRAAASDFFPALAITVGLLGVINIWFNLLLRIGEKYELVDRLMTEYVETAGAFSPAVGYFWLILGISILTPIAEELLFRGIIQGELRKAMPEWAAVVIQAIVFAAFHWQPVQVSYVLLPGLMLGLLYAWTRSIWVPIAMHIVFNFLGSVLPALVGEDETLSQIVGTSQLAFILIGILCLVFLWRNTAARRRQSAL